MADAGRLQGVDQARLHVRLPGRGGAAHANGGRQAQNFARPPIPENTYSSIGQPQQLYGLETLVLPTLRPGSDQSTPLHINIQLRNQQTGRIVWFADIYCDLITDDRAELIQALSVPIIANLGKTARQEPF